MKGKHCRSYQLTMPFQSQSKGVAPVVYSFLITVVIVKTVLYIRNLPPYVKQETLKQLTVIHMHRILTDQYIFHPTRYIIIFTTEIVDSFLMQVLLSKGEECLKVLFISKSSNLCRIQSVSG